MYCMQCGLELNEGSNFCQKCGARIGGASVSAAPQPIIVNVNNSNSNVNQVNANAPYPSKSKWIAFFLCLLLGEFGFHRFYVGKVGTGILWLLTLGLFGIGWILDLMIILVGSFRDKAGYPLH